MIYCLIIGAIYSSNNKFDGINSGGHGQLLIIMDEDCHVDEHVLTILSDSSQWF